MGILIVCLMLSQAEVLPEEATDEVVEEVDYKAELEATQAKLEEAEAKAAKAEAEAKANRKDAALYKEEIRKPTWRIYNITRKETPDIMEISTVLRKGTKDWPMHCRKALTSKAMACWIYGKTAALVVFNRKGELVSRDLFPVSFSESTKGHFKSLKKDLPKLVKRLW